MSEIAIRVANLSYTYGAKGDRTLRKSALRDISLEITSGTCAAIVGVTGSGKSTLIQHFNGLLLPTSGSVSVAGIQVGARKAELPLLRQRVGMLFQQAESQLFERSVYADVAFGPARQHLHRQVVRERVRLALELVGLPPDEFAMRSPFELSGGQRRRVALAGVLAMNPTILILDEPGTGLDAEAKQEFYSYIHFLRRRGITIVLVSHDMQEVADLADQLFVLYEGQLVMQGTPREVFTQPQRLLTYGLCAPSLSQLLAHLRQRGLAIPDDVFTLDEAFTYLSSLQP